MQVNNNYSPNFGMALRIDPKAAGKLRGQTMEYLQTLKKAGEECATHKHVDLLLDENLVPIVKRRDCANAYYDYFRNNGFDGLASPDNCLAVSTRWAGSESVGLKKGENYTANLVFETREEASAARETLMAADKVYDGITPALEFAKLQEASLAYKARVAEAAAKLQAQVDTEVENLMSAFTA